MYSPDLKNVVLYLLSKPGPRKTIEEVFALMGGRVVDELNSSLVYVLFFFFLSSQSGGADFSPSVADVTTSQCRRHYRAGTHA
jgi:hypothetical protein